MKILSLLVINEWKFIPQLISSSSSFSQYIIIASYFPIFRYMSSTLETFLIIIWKACGVVDDVSESSSSSVIKSTFCGIYTRHTILSINVIMIFFSWENSPEWKIFKTSIRLNRVGINQTWIKYYCLASQTPQKFLTGFYLKYTLYYCLGGVR